ncbi:GNAT family N-acetyltransferase [Aegicerativicinus sediminis]|uniref:GNAT family N-acetyltransferase n=1 Tax=Aegicerativicinus sediminis TaxID=2893202 RepID=UPI001E609E76|nr:GNAT family N-acetyltransferase [Aegicerativicinus sediminis]
MAIEIITYKPKFRKHFYELNIEWLQNYFYVEPYDEEVLSKPEIYILDKGGDILFLMDNGTVVGTSALMPTADKDVMELTKMAIEPSQRGKKFGNLLLKETIDYAKGKNLKELILYSNRILENAIHLYRKFGFIEEPLEANLPYKRANIKMRLKLH